MENTNKDRRIYTNRVPGCVCVGCNQIIAIGQEKTWERTGKGKPSRNWHTSCTPNDGVAVRDARMEDETAENQTDFESTEENQTKRVDAVETKKEVKAKPSAGAWLDGLAGAILPYLEERLETKLDASEVESIVKKMLDGAILLTATKVVIETKATGQVVDAGVQHKQFPDLLNFVQAGVNVWLTGPAGSGKTTAVLNAGKYMGLKAYHVGAMDTEYKLLGFVDAKGEVVKTVFREWWLNGGMMCLDEVDSWLPNAALALNNALANGHCTFPDGRFEKHPDAYAVACANTWGNSPTPQYVGRFKQDDAFLDRFIQYDWGYDEALEAVICKNAAWAKRVAYLRANAVKKGLKVIISPRASVNGAKLLAQGIPQPLVEQVTVRKGMTAEQWGSIQ